MASPTNTTNDRYSSLPRCGAVRSTRGEVKLASHFPIVRDRAFATCASAEMMRGRLLTAYLYGAADMAAHGARSTQSR